MWLLSLLTVLTLGLTAIAALQWDTARRRLERTQAVYDRILANRAEKARFFERREELAGRSEMAEAAVSVGTSVTQASHQTIAAIPFEILEAIPSTRETTKVVRGIHDEIAGNVYTAINLLNKGIATSVRKGRAANAAANAAAAAAVAAPPPVPDPADAIAAPFPVQAPPTVEDFLPGP